MRSPVHADADVENKRNGHVIDVDKNDSVVVVIETKSPEGIGQGSQPNRTQIPLDIAETVQRARNAYDRGVTKSIEWRRTQLKNLLRMYEENKEAIIDALHKDLRRSKMEAVMLEVDYLINDLKNTIHYLDEWTKPEKPSKEIVNILDDVIVYHEPYGVALVIGAWNYPLQLLLLPVSGAIAAGNAVVVKPSELAEACSRFVVDTLPRYLDNAAIKVVPGGATETTELLKQKFDYIFYTGGTNVGRIIYEAAVKNLTPVTLELGGKCPAYIDNEVDISVTAKRIIWGKFINAGQTCIAPDYILCTKEVQDKFINEARKILKTWYGDNSQKSPDFCRIVNNSHFNRLKAILDADSGRIVIGGGTDEQDKFIELTILANVQPTDRVMQDEIFGPILPIVTIRNTGEAMQFINERQRPLVMYLFTEKKRTQKQFIDNTSSGGICVNDTVMQMAVDTLPFGGIGHSGMGAYHGKATFDTFTHKKSCLVRGFAAVGEKLGSVRYPPYTESNLSQLTMLMKKRHAPSLKFLPYLLTFAIGFGVSYAIFTWIKVTRED